jgi:4'-phosphopantetheinyl transferase EntD
MNSLLEASPSLIDVRSVRFATSVETFPLTVLSFDASRFSTRAFETADIECPESIARSVAKRQAEFYSGRVAAKLALSPWGQEGRNIGIGSSREPIWPEGILGSISHTDRHAVSVAIARGRHRGIGVDVERVMDAALCERVSSMVADGDELTLLANLGDACPLETALTILFSSKESFFKGVFGEVGRYFDFAAVRILDFDLEAKAVRMRLVESLNEELVSGREFVVWFELLEPDVVITLFVW